MADIMVKAEHIEKSFGSTEVLKDISFSLEKGKVLKSQETFEKLYKILKENKNNLTIKIL